MILFFIIYVKNYVTNPFVLDLIRDSNPMNETGHLHSHHAVIFSTLLAFKDDLGSLTKLVDGGIIDLLTGMHFALHYNRKPAMNIN